MIAAAPGNSALLESGPPAEPAGSPVSAWVRAVLDGDTPRCDSPTFLQTLDHYQDPIFSALIRQYLNRRHHDQADPEARQDYTHDQTSENGRKLHSHVDGAIAAAVAYGLTQPVAFTLRLADDQNHDDALKLLKAAVKGVLQEAGGLPLVWVFVKVPATQKERAHLHGVVFLPPGPAPQAQFPKTGRPLSLDEVARPRQWLPLQLQAWAEGKNKGKPGAVKFWPVYDLWGWTGYLGRRDNLGRRSATVHASQASKNPAGHMPALNHNGFPLNAPARPSQIVQDAPEAFGGADVPPAASCASTATKTAARRASIAGEASPAILGPARRRQSSPQAQPPPSDVQALQVQAEVDLA